MQEVSNHYLCGRCGTVIPSSHIFTRYISAPNPPVEIYCPCCTKKYGTHYNYLATPFCSLCFSSQYIYAYNRTDYSNFYCSNPECKSYHFTIAKDRRSCRVYFNKTPFFTLQLRLVDKPQLYFKASEINCYLDNKKRPNNAVRTLFFQILKNKGWKIDEVHNKFILTNL